jgi:hypothetical protein
LEFGSSLCHGYLVPGYIVLTDGERDLVTNATLPLILTTMKRDASSVTMKAH